MAIPEAGSIVASAGLLLVQVPLGVLLERAVVRPGQTVNTPVIEPGSGFTVIGNIEKHEPSV